MKKIAFITLTSLALTGCINSQPDVDVLRYISEVKQEPSGSITPLPAVPAQRYLSFEGANKRDPFIRYIADNLIENTNNEARIVSLNQRKRDYLESYSIEQLKPMGTIRDTDDRDQLKILLRTPKGEVYKVGIGDYVGINHGQLIEILEDHFILSEIIMSGSVDNFIERERILKVQL